MERPAFLGQRLVAAEDQNDKLCRSGYGLQLSSRQSRELTGWLDAPERICRQFFRMLREHIDPSACKFRNDAEKFSW
ncbi:hypothetical protein WN73_20325 [Bradyrhizobium sp. CCBAU 45394]|nr:hypothetical protein [Bradyrhizobium sp. CCBAU 45394]